MEKENLIQRRCFLEKELLRIANETNKKEESIDSLDKEISIKQNEYNQLAEENNNIKDMISVKKQKLEILFKEMRIYKNELREQEKEKLQNEFRKIVNYTNNLEFNFNLNVLKVFEKLKKVESKSRKFENLHRKIVDLQKKEKNKLKEMLIENIKHLMKDNRKMHDLIFSFRFLQEYESFFNDELLVTFFYYELSDGFSYHFLTNKDTNRLDKPEWGFEYLLKKLEYYKRYCYIYEKALNNERNKLDKFTELVLKTLELIKIKLKEYSISKSHQKRNLIIHFFDEFLMFRSEVKKKHSIDIPIKDASSLLLNVQKEYLSESISKIHQKNYKEWFNEFKKLYKENKAFCSNYMKHDATIFTVLNETITDNILIFIEAFIGQMRFLKKEEIKALCFMHTEVENLKLFLSDMEIDIIMLVNDDNVYINTEKFSKLNNENLNLIKNIASSDITSILKNIRNFKYISEKNLVNFKIDLSNIYKEYEKLLLHSFNVVEFVLFKKLDLFIFEEIVLKIKFEEEELKSFKDFFRNIQRVFKDKFDWKSKVGINCIDDYFNGRKCYDEEDSLYSIIYKLYDN